jgi:hypothetical protein
VYGFKKSIFSYYLVGLKKYSFLKNTDLAFTNKCIVYFLYSKNNQVTRKEFTKNLCGLIYYGNISHPESLMYAEKEKIHPPYIYIYIYIYMYL